MPGDCGRTCGCTMTIVLCAALASPGLAGAQRRGGGDEPIVSALELYGTLEGDRARDLDPGREIELTPQQSLTIEAEPRDQYGRRFPTDRFHMGAELGRDCRGVLSVSERSAGELRFTAGRERGACRALVWVAGNLNLEFELRFEVTGLGTANYTRNQAVEIAERLYRAVLQREMDGGSRAATVAEVQRGRIQNQVESMVRSGEFTLLRAEQEPAALLEAFYQGLLERPPDSGGARDYLGEIGRGRYVAALMNLIQSNEFEQAILDVR